jgi:hypothetical protein
MANKFEVQIVALDRFTKVFRNLNTQASKAVRPLTNAQRQVGMLAREMHLDKLAKGLGKVGQASLSIGRSLGVVAPQMEALFGFGIAGGIVATAGALVALTARWGNLGYEVNRTAGLIGVSTDDLQRYRGAAKLAGVDSAVLTRSLATLGDTLQDAQFGRNPQALIILNRLGISIKRNASGVIDSVAAFKDISLAISRIADPRVQAIVARAFGLEDALPLLKMGPAAIEELAKQAEKFGLVAGGDALKGAQKFGEELNRLKGAIEGVANSWGQKLLPIITSGMSATTNALNSRGLGGALWDVFSGRLTREAVFGATPPPVHKVSGVVTGGPGEPLGLRQNNPGNLRSWSGMPSANGFAVFPSPTAGLNAMAQQIGLYGSRDGLNTVGGIVGKYAPPSENNTAAYIAEVARATGFKPDQQLNLSDPKVMAPLLSAMVKHEQGKQPFTDEQYADAAKTVKVEIDMKNAPPGTTAQAKQGNSFLPTRVSYSMPTGDPL